MKLKEDKKDSKKDLKKIKLDSNLFDHINKIVNQEMNFINIKEEKNINKIINVNQIMEKNIKPFKEYFFNHIDEIKNY